jgi:hypothetical protein
MRIKFRRGSWIIAPVLVLSFFSPLGASASVESGLTATYYNNNPNGYNQYNAAPPMPSVTGNPVAGTETVSRVQQNFDQSPRFEMYEDFMVQYEGYVTSPVSGTFRFWPQGDDGTMLYIDDVLVQNDWRDKGGGGAFSSYITFEAGASKKFEMWFYENGGGAWTTLYWDIGNGWEVVPDSAFTKETVPTTTTIQKYLGQPQNVVLTDTGSSIRVDWSAAEDDAVISPERYAISWSTGGSGWGVATGNVGGENSLNTYIELDYQLFATTGGLEAEYLVTVRADNDTNSVYSQSSEPVILKIGEIPPPPTTTTTTTTSTTTTTEPEQTTTTEPEITIPEEPVAGPIAPDTPEAQVPQQEEPEETPATTVPPELEEETQNEIDQIDPEEISTTALSNAVSNIIDGITDPDELGAAIDNILDKPLNDEQFAAVIDEVFSEPLSTEELASVLEAVFDKPISDEKFDEVISNVLEQPLSDEQFAAVVDILENESITEEQVASVVDAVLESGVTEDQATELATSAKVLESIDGEQAAEIFDTIDISEVTPEEAAEIVDAVQDAPEEVRNSFEEEINVFEGAVDTYVPLGSEVSVGVRRAVIAATAVLSITALPTSPSSGSSSGGSGGFSGESRRRIK